MSEVTASWIQVIPSGLVGHSSANRVFQRIEVYSTPPDAGLAASASVGNTFVPAQFGGNVLNIQEGFVVIQKASGKRKGIEVSVFKGSSLRA